MSEDKPKEISRSLAYYHQHREAIAKKRKEYYNKNRKALIERSKRYAEEVLKPKLERQKQGLEPADTLEAMRRYQNDYYNKITKPGRNLIKQQRKGLSNE